MLCRFVGDIAIGKRGSAELLSKLDLIILFLIPLWGQVSTIMSSYPPSFMRGYGDLILPSRNTGIFGAILLITVRSQFGGLNGTPWRQVDRKYGFTNYE